MSVQWVWFWIIMVMLLPVWITVMFVAVQATVEAIRARQRK